MLSAVAVSTGVAPACVALALALSDVRREEDATIPCVSVPLSSLSFIDAKYGPSDDQRRTRTADPFPAIPLFPAVIDTEDSELELVTAPAASPSLCSSGI